MNISLTINDNRGLVMPHIIVVFSGSPVSVFAQAARQRAIYITSDYFNLVLSGCAKIFAQAVIFRPLE